MNSPDSFPTASCTDIEGVRYMHLESRFIQGAMRLDDPSALELDFIRQQMAWLLWRPSGEMRKGHVVQLGLGAGGLTRFCHTVLGLRTTVVEINPEVIEANRRWFHLPDDERVKVVLDDAARWVRDPAHAGTAQAINVDVYDHEAAKPVLDAVEFYADCHLVLDDQGLMTVNLFGRDADVAGSCCRIAEVFGHDRVWVLAPQFGMNVAVIASRSVQALDADELDRRIDQIERLDLPARAWLRQLKPLSAYLAQSAAAAA
jgi:spermidine synthase